MTKSGSAVCFLLLLATPAVAPDFRFGIKAGVPVTTYFETGATGSLHGGSDYSAATRRYTVGASAEWRLGGRLGFEIDALYKRMGYVGIVNTFSNGISTTSALDAKGNSWDFPLLAKYRFDHIARPYVAAGALLRYIGPVRARGQVTVEDLVQRTTVRTPIDTGDPSDLRKRLYPGMVMAGGIEIGSGRLHFLPEFRYTRWTANISGPGGVLRFNPNQAEFLVGLLF